MLHSNAFGERQRIDTICTPEYGYEDVDGDGFQERVEVGCDVTYVIMDTKTGGIWEEWGGTYSRPCSDIAGCRNAASTKLNYLSTTNLENGEKISTYEDTTSENLIFIKTDLNGNETYRLLDLSENTESDIASQFEVANELTIADTDNESTDGSTDDLLTVYKDASATHYLVVTEKNDSEKEYHLIDLESETETMNVDNTNKATNEMLTTYISIGATAAVAVVITSSIIGGKVIIKKMKKEHHDPELADKNRQKRNGTFDLGGGFNDGDDDDDDDGHSHGYDEKKIDDLLKDLKGKKNGEGKLIPITGIVKTYISLQSK